MIRRPAALPRNGSGGGAFGTLFATSVQMVRRNHGLAMRRAFVDVSRVHHTNSHVCRVHHTNRQSTIPCRVQQGMLLVPNGRERWPVARKSIGLTKTAASKSHGATDGSPMFQRTKSKNMGTHAVMPSRLGCVATCDVEPFATLETWWEIVTTVESVHSSTRTSGAWRRHRVQRGIPLVLTGRERCTKAKQSFGLTSTAVSTSSGRTIRNRMFQRTKLKRMVIYAER